MLPLTAILLLTTADPAPPAEFARGKALLDAAFRAETAQIEKEDLAAATSKAAWEAERPRYRQQVLEMLGLWPLPERTDLKATVTGTLERDGVIIEKLHFQSRPGLYVTANLYRPAAPPAGKLPAVLYVCGHGNVVEDGVSYGSKVAYQHHPAWFARNGYVSIVLDTLELGESNGDHHGTYRRGWWDWHSSGYTPAGVECWNAMRALDYLESRSDVDPKRMGVTGRSGGSATSWWLMAADDRPACAVPVAGVADLYAHVADGHAPGRLASGLITGHCDCMYMTNTYRWDFARLAAMCAPRPLLLGNSDADPIFPVLAYRRVAERVKKVYALYDAADRFGLLETVGPHKDTPELREGAFRWMNRWLKDSTDAISDPAWEKIKPQELKVFATLPADSANPVIHETFVPVAKPPQLPEKADAAKAWWKDQSTTWRKQLQEHVFAGWPTNPPSLNVKSAGEVTAEDLRLRAWDFTSQEGVELRLWLLTAPKAAKTSLVVLDVLDAPAWTEWLTQLGPAFGAAIPTPHPEPFPFDKTRLEQNRRVMEKFGWAFAAVAPRGVGPTAWATPGSAEEVQIRRRFPLIGQTLEGQQAWDVRRAIAALATVPELKDVPRWLQAKRAMAGVALAAGLDQPSIARFDLWNLPPSFAQGPMFLNVRRYLDTPQMLALLAPQPVRLYVKTEEEKAAWAWPLALQKQLGEETLKLRVVAE